MKLLKGAMLVALALITFSAAGTNPPERVLVADFFRNPERWQYQLSPDGKWISYLYLKPIGNSRRLNICVRRTDDSDADGKCVTSETTRDITDYFWKGNDHLIYTLDRNCDERVHIYIVDRDATQPPVDLTTRPDVYALQIANRLDSSNDGILIRSKAKGADPEAAYRYSVVNGVSPKVGPAAKNPIQGTVRRWITDGRGIVRALVVVDGLDVTLLARSNATEQFQSILSTKFPYSIGQPLRIFGEEPIHFLPTMIEERAVMAFTREHAKEVICALSNIDQNTRALVTIDPVTKEVKTLYRDERFDVDGAEFSANGAAAVTFLDCRTERRFLKPPNEVEAVYKKVAEQPEVSSDDEIWITSQDRDAKRFIIETSSDRNPGRCYLFEPAKNSFRELAKYAQQLEGKLSPTECICYTSRDSKTEIQGYLTVPSGYDGKQRLPLVVIPHEGPWFRNVWGFAARENKEVPFFASRGYAVLQMNFRGSTGFGNDFWQAGFKQFGQAMQDDVTDGVLWAINKRKIADPKRIAIVGESYGGYAALAGITFTHETDFRYAAAVDRAGVSDLVTFMDMHKNNAQYCEMIGDPDKDRIMLTAVSPALHADCITAPLLVAHGLNDHRVECSQSDEIVAALQQHHPKPEYLEFNEGHVFVNEENRIAYYEAVDKFLEKYLH